MEAKKRNSNRSLRENLRSPGRPPVLHRAERWPFWEAIAQGYSSEDAAAIAGVSQPVGGRWFRECGGMPPSHLAPSAPEPTDRYLSFAEREQIALARARGDGVRAIARHGTSCFDDLTRAAAQRGHARRWVRVPGPHGAVARRPHREAPKACQTGDEPGVAPVRARSTRREHRDSGRQNDHWATGSVERSPSRAQAIPPVVTSLEP